MTQPAGRFHAFIDTSGFFAALRGDDADNALALDTMRRLVESGHLVCTSNFVVAETHALLLTRRNRFEAHRFLASFDEGGIAIVRVSEADEGQARAIIEQYADKDFSYTDATSFALIQRLGIPSALSFDRHFLQFGIPLP